MSENAEKDQAPRVRGEQDPLRLHADRDNLEENRRFSSGDGGEQIRGNREDFPALNTEWGEAVIGKILSQLRELREAHLAYVNAHSDRLRARLAEDEEHRSKIITDMDELEQQLLQIQVKQKSPAISDESG